MSTIYSDLIFTHYNLMKRFKRNSFWFGRRFCSIFWLKIILKKSVWVSFKGRIFICLITRRLIGGWMVKWFRELLEFWRVSRRLRGRILKESFILFWSFRFRRLPIRFLSLLKSKFLGVRLRLWFIWWKGRRLRGGLSMVFLRLYYSKPVTIYSK